MKMFRVYVYSLFTLYTKQPRTSVPLAQIGPSRYAAVSGLRYEDVHFYSVEGLNKLR